MVAEITKRNESANEHVERGDQLSPHEDAGARFIQELNADQAPAREVDRANESLTGHESVPGYESRPGQGALPGHESAAGHESRSGQQSGLAEASERVDDRLVTGSLLKDLKAKDGLDAHKQQQGLNAIEQRNEIDIWKALKDKQEEKNTAKHFLADLQITNSNSSADTKDVASQPKFVSLSDLMVPSDPGLRADDVSKFEPGKFDPSQNYGFFTPHPDVTPYPTAESQQLFPVDKQTGPSIPEIKLGQSSSPSILDVSNTAGSGAPDLPTPKSGTQPVGLDPSKLPELNPSKLPELDPSKLADPGVRPTSGIVTDLPRIDPYPAVGQAQIVFNGGPVRNTEPPANPKAPDGRPSDGITGGDVHSADMQHTTGVIGGNPVPPWIHDQITQPNLGSHPSIYQPKEDNTNRQIATTGNQKVTLEEQKETRRDTSTQINPVYSPKTDISNVLKTSNFAPATEEKKTTEELKSRQAAVNETAQSKAESDKTGAVEHFSSAEKIAFERNLEGQNDSNFLRQMKWLNSLLFCRVILISTANSVLS